VKTCAADSMNTDSFLKEVRFTTALRHDHIVKLYGVCTRAGSEMFIITELMSRGDLKHYLLNNAGNDIHVPDLMCFAIQVTALD